MNPIGTPTIYGWTHQQERAHWDTQLEAFGPIPCRRCGKPVYADRDARLNPDRQPFDLGHPDPGQTGKRPEHATCNRSEGGREGNRRKHQARHGIRHSRDWDEPSAGTDLPRRVVILAGPPGAGKTTAAHRSGLTVYDRDDYTGEATFTTDLDTLGTDPRARAVVIRWAPTSTDRARLAAQVQATETYLLLADRDLLARRLQRRRRDDRAGTLAALNSWFEAFDRQDGVQSFPGWS